MANRVDSKARSKEANCDIIESHFPSIGKCCVKQHGEIGVNYEKKCPYCSVMTLPPDSSSLEISTFFECIQNGYGKRLKD